ncbi:Bromodomain containing protein [Histomonas meleagridis]|nr:Bromodomain containing protein [Histomonas meleagridis]
MTRLEENYYPSVEDWKKDVNLIWKNATTYHSEQTCIYVIAKELNDAFRKLCENIPRTELEVWTCKVRKTHQKLMKLIDAKPDLTKKSNISLGMVPKPRQTKIFLRQNSTTSVS